MGLTIAQKIIKAHLLGGEMTVGSEIALRIDQTLTQDSTGTMAYLQFEAMGIGRVRTMKRICIKFSSNGKSTTTCSSSVSRNGYSYSLFHTAFDTFS